MRVSYLEEPEVAMTATLIHTWVRGEIPAPVMSASSGPKDYTRNHIWAIFERFPHVASVLMVRGQYTHSDSFLLVKDVAGAVWDMAGKAVVMED